MDDPLSVAEQAAAAPAGPLAAETSDPISIPGAAADGGSGSGEGESEAFADAEDSGGGGGELPSPSPADPLDPETLERLLKKASPAVGPTRFSVSDVLKDPSLQRAARRELAGVAAEPGAPGSLSSDPDPFAAAGLDAGGHDGEVDRQRAAVRELDEQVAAESRVNRGMAAVLLERLDSSRKALEGLAKLVGSLAESQQAYAASLEAAAKLTLAGDCDGASMRPAMAALAALPKAMGAAHSQLAALLRGLASGVRTLLREYQTACKDIRGGATTLQRGIESGRRSLAAAFDEHKSVCEGFDAAAGRSGPRARLIRGPEQDPWATEGRLVRQHRALQAWQDKERAFLKESFARVQDLEAQRVRLTQAVAASLSDGYARALAPLPDAAAALAPAISDIDGEAELAELHRVALDTGTAAEALAARQAHAIEDAASDLFCSPEILRQGPMRVWDGRGGGGGSAAGAWAGAHCVLTRAGFMHWFKSMDDPEPLDVLNLGRCQFEQGKAPVFNLLEAGSGAISFLSGRSRKVTFEAPSVEECCEWAIALREGIALATTGTSPSGPSHRRTHSTHSSGGVPG